MTRRNLILAFLAATFLPQADRPAAADTQRPQKNPTDSEKIVVRPDMVVNEVAQGDAFALFDESAESGDPRSGHGGQPHTAWTVEDGKLYYPLTAYIDLGAVTHITDIYVYDGQGTGDFRVESGSPFHWQPLVFDPLTNYLVWNRHPVDVRTRYLRFTIADPGTVVPGVVLYGRPPRTAQADVAAPHIKPRPLPTIDGFIGTNAFITDPVEKMAPVGYIREYHDWSWDAGDAAYPHNRLALNPSYAAGGNAWLFDDYYAKLKAAGLTVCPAIQGNVGWLAGDDSRLNWKVAAPGQDPASPASYAAHADEMFQYAARYGSAHVPDELLKLAPNQPRKSGLGLLRYFENANEANGGWWAGPNVYSSPYQFAAQCSADYDGHRGSMGRTVGVKNADPNAKMVMGGLTGKSLPDILNYVKAMKAWADWNRDGSFPADVLNFHHYAGDDARMPDHPFGNANGHSISPEDDRLVEQFQPIIDYRNRWLPQCELWVTEIGYDTNPGSPQVAPAIGQTSTEEVQARWIVRSYLALAAAGVDRVAQYMLNDVNPQDPTQFSSSGLVTDPQKGEWNPKPSWYYTATLKHRLHGMRFAGEIASGNEKVLIYRFRSDRGTGAYAVWCPTSENATIAGYMLACPRSARQATCVEFTVGSVTGREVRLQPVNSQVAVDVSERPLLVLVDSMPLGQ